MRAPRERPRGRRASVPEGAARASPRTPRRFLTPLRVLWPGGTLLYSRVGWCRGNCLLLLVPCGQRVLICATRACGRQTRSTETQRHVDTTRESDLCLIRRHWMPDCAYRVIIESICRHFSEISICNNQYNQSMLKIGYFYVSADKIKAESVDNCRYISPRSLIGWRKSGNQCLRIRQV